jgi:hypothetical protein
MSHLKACMAMDATPGSPQCRGRPPGPGVTAMPAAALPGGQAATKWVLFSDPVVSPAQQDQPRICPGAIFFSPAGRFLYALGWQLHKSSIRNASGNRL